MEWIKCSERMPNEPNNRWISVYDRLPEDERQQVLMTDGDRCYVSARNNIVWLDSYDAFYIPGKSGAGIRVTHWMPLPEPPKDSSTDRSTD